ncbi:MAG: polysaccharide biosynthesis protein GumE [Hyphomicrobium sp.]|jgi:putative polymerase
MLSCAPASPVPRPAAPSSAGEHGPEIATSFPIQLAAGSILFAAVTFNAALAVVNAHVVSLSPAVVIGCESVIVAAAYGVVFSSLRPQMVPWLVLLGILVMLSLLRGIATQTFDAKSLRDVALIPTFVLLGMTFDWCRLTRLLVVLHAVVLFFLLFEAVDTAAFSELFQIKSYYIGTRGYDSSAFWNSESELFVSATRPDGRLFSFVDLHRLSSLFLEPVSLGNYCMVAVAYVCAVWRRLGWPALLFLSIGTALMIVGCDSRLASVMTIALVLVTMAAPYLPRRSAIVYPPLAVLGAFLLVAVLAPRAGLDDFKGRVAHTVMLLQSYDLPELLGISNRFLDKAVDSGLAYLISTQSLVGVILLWTAVIFASKEDTPDQARFTHALAIYLALSMTVSYSLLSIKSAALLWFIHGSLQAQSFASTRKAEAFGMQSASLQ